MCGSGDPHDCRSGDRRYFKSQVNGQVVPVAVFVFTRKTNPILKM
jgi:hypothetical protein